MKLIDLIFRVVLFIFLAFMSSSSVYTYEESPDLYDLILREADLLSDKHVNYFPPLEQPDIEWELRLDGLFTGYHLIDDRSNIWMSSDRPLRDRRHTSIFYIDRDGNLFPIQGLGIYIYTPPVLVTKESVLFLNHDELLCLDLDGKFLWKTKITHNDQLYNRVYQISHGRMLIHAGERNSGMFDMYCIKTGEYLSSLSFLDWDKDCDNFPIELPNGAWIGFSDYYIAKYDDAFNIVWKYKQKEKKTQQYYALTNEYQLLIGNQNSLIAINTFDGTILWERTDVKSAIPIDVDKNGNIIVGTLFSIRKLSQDGVDIWVKYPRRGLCYFSKSIIYVDNSILFANDSGISLIDNNGDFIWDINTMQMGLSSNMMVGCELSATSDGRVIFSYVDTQKEKPTRIISFK